MITGKIRWDEGPIQVNNGNASSALRYFLYSDDPANDGRDEAYSWLVNNVPTSLYGLKLSELNVTERIADATDEAIWAGEARYALGKKVKPKQLSATKEGNDENNKLLPGESRLSVRSGAGTTLNLTHSYEFIDEIYLVNTGGVNIWQWGGDPQIRHLLNVETTKDDETSMFRAKGISVPGGSVELIVETCRYDEDVTDNGYLVTAALWAGRNACNDRDWYGFPIRSVKLLSVDAKQRADAFAADSFDNLSDWDVVFTFGYSPEISAAELNANKPPGLRQVADWIEPKRGWDYLDILYVDSTYSRGGVEFVIPQAVRASLHRIYPEINFASVLKIGG